MSKTTLVCDSNNEARDALEKMLTKNTDVLITSVASGNSAQVEIHRNRFKLAIIDLDAKDSSSFEAISYIKLNSTGTKIILTYEDPMLLRKIGVEHGKTYKMGVNALVQKPINENNFVKLVESMLEEKSSAESMNKIDANEKEEFDYSDNLFFEMPILDFYSGNITVLDLYLRLGQNKYVKIIHKGDFVPKQLVEEYKFKKKIDSFYFKKSDRLLYINYVNDFLDKYLKETDPNYSEVIKATNNLIQSYLDEINTEGLKPELKDVGIRISEMIYQMLKEDKVVGKYLKELEETSPKVLSHVFLTTIFSSIITTNLKWATQYTHDYVIQGALLHDIGKAKIPEHIRSKNFDDMTIEERVIYKTHPEESYNMLCEAEFPQQIKQIAYQHHEWINGDGFPNGLSGIRIYPLAKIISFAGDFAEFIIERKLTPIDGLKEFIPNKELISRYDASCIKAFFKGFKYYKLEDKNE